MPATITPMIQASSTFIKAAPAPISMARSYFPIWVIGSIFKRSFMIGRVTFSSHFGLKP
ncbi:hypothetical protein ACFQ9Y_20220 [Peribacillus simplex]|uniref:hypothetical protein n=1 Tax=Peribacillus simplex TaxID=1478 RepID=UPI003672A1B6